MEKGYYYFEKETLASGWSGLNNKTLLELWNGFCFHAGFLTVSNNGDECFGFKTGETDYPALQQGQEYIVEVTEKGISIIAVNQESLIRGFMALILRIEAVSLAEGQECFRIAVCHLASRYTINMRMIHFCVFPETSAAFLRKFIRLAGILQYTHLILEFWGMLKYDCLKELSWENAYSKDQLKVLIQEIENMGMHAIPMFNHLGHASGCRVSGGKHVVLDQNPRLATLFAEDGWAWNIENPEAHALLKKIRAELYDLFPNTEYIHLGCDEVYSYESGDDNQAKMRQYLHDLIEEVKSEGKKPIIWGDMLLNPEACMVEKPYFCGCDTPENAVKMAECIPKDTIIADWHYDVQQAPIKTSLYLKEHGFSVLGTPWHRSDNCKAFVDTIRNYDLMGILVTTWHTLSEKMTQIIAAAVLCGAYHSPWAGLSKNEIETETATILRKAYFVRGNYAEAGWTDSQIFKQAQPLA